jgi:hypothetical protein
MWIQSLAQTGGQVVIFHLRPAQEDARSTVLVLLTQFFNLQSVDAMLVCISRAVISRHFTWKRRISFTLVFIALVFLIISMIPTK